MDLDKFTKPTSAFTTPPSSLQLDTREYLNLKFSPNLSA